MRPAARREAVGQLLDLKPAPSLPAGGSVALGGASYRPRNDEGLPARLKELAAHYRRYG